MGYFDAGNRFSKTNSIVKIIIGINIAVYLLQLLFKSHNITQWGALHYYTSPLFYPHQLITSVFMHDDGGFTHILFNMFCLYTFGTMLEQVWGSKKFFSFYMICGVGASIIMMLSIPFTAAQMVNSIQGSGILEENREENIDTLINIYTCLGASGAVMGVEAAFAYLFPNTELMLMFIPVPVKAKYLIPVLLLIDLFGGFYRIAGDNIGHFAHLGGALIGFLLVLYWNKTNMKTFY
jgi:membrane associated rhomboid family serine protease